MKVSVSRVVLIVALISAGGCGSGSGTSGAGGLSRFVGTWKPTSGTSTTICPAKTTTESITSNTVWGAGVSSDLVETDGACNIQVDVTGSTASSVSGQSCTQTAGTASVTLTISAYTFALGADGQTATESGSGTATVTSAGVTATCSYSESASYQKLAN